MRIALASASPRRRELIKKIEGLDVFVCPSNTNENIPFTNPKDYVIELAYLKAKSVFDNVGYLTLGADTIVCADGKILGKPKNRDEAYNYLRLLSGRTHEVMTGICLISDKKTIKTAEQTRVTFHDFNEDVIERYIASASPFDKAGGYGIQDELFAPMIKKVDGDIFNVIGLPIELLRRVLEENF